MQGRLKTNPPLQASNHATPRIIPIWSALNQAKKSQSGTNPSKLASLHVFYQNQASKEGSPRSNSSTPSQASCHTKLVGQEESSPKLGCHFQIELYFLVQILNGFSFEF